MEDLIEAVKCFALVKQGGSVQDFVAATKRIRMDRTAPLDTASCLDDPVAALAPDECLRRMKESRILAVGGGWPGIAPDITQEMGIEVVNVPFEEVNAAWEVADKDQCRAIADDWQKNAGRCARCFARDAGNLCGHVSGPEGRAQETQRQRHHDQLPGRILRQTHSCLSLPGIPPVAQRRIGGSV